jgi:hypothetical protein
MAATYGSGETKRAAGAPRLSVNVSKSQVTPMSTVKDCSFARCPCLGFRAA